MRNFYYYDKLDSTMLEYHRLKEINDRPLAVRVGTQDDGIGRANHIWLSPPGGLWFTFDYEYTKALPSFSLYLGFCIHKCLISLFEPLNGKLKIKWTNDIIYGGRKLGGILCHYLAGKRTYVIGIGLNTNNEIDSELGKLGATNLKDVLGFEISNSELCRQIIFSVEDNCKYMEDEMVYLTYCNENLFGRDRRALVESGGINIEAEITGIAPSGALLIRNDWGDLISVHTGSIIDFLD